MQRSSTNSSGVAQRPGLMLGPVTVARSNPRPTRVDTVLRAVFSGVRVRIHPAGPSRSLDGDDRESEDLRRIRESKESAMLRVPRLSRVVIRESDQASSEFRLRPSHLLVGNGQESRVPSRSDSPESEEERQSRRESKMSAILEAPRERDVVISHDSSELHRSESSASVAVEIPEKFLDPVLFRTMLMPVRVDNESLSIYDIELVLTCWMRTFVAKEGETRIFDPLSGVLSSYHLVEDLGLAMEIEGHPGAKSEVDEYIGDSRFGDIREYRTEMRNAYNVFKGIVENTEVPDPEKRAHVKGLLRDKLGIDLYEHSVVIGSDIENPGVGGGGNGRTSSVSSHLGAVARSLAGTVCFGSCLALTVLMSGGGVATGIVCIIALQNQGEDELASSSYDEASDLPFIEEDNAQWGGLEDIDADDYMEAAILLLLGAVVSTVGLVVLHLLRIGRLER